MTAAHSSKVFKVLSAYLLKFAKHLVDKMRKYEKSIPKALKEWECVANVVKVQNA